MSTEAYREIREEIVERAPVGLLSLDQNGVIQWTNGEYAQLLGIPRDELIGMPFESLVEAGYYEQVTTEQYLDGLRDILSSSSTTDRSNYAVRTHLGDSETLIHDVSMALLPFNDGEFQGTVIAFRDITTRKNYERELARQNELLEEFTSVVTHDLRNPLNVAQGYTDLALETGDTEHLEKVIQAHGRMETLIGELLSLTAEGKMVEEFEVVSLEDVATRAWDFVATEKCSLVIEPHLGSVKADPSRLQQLFENLFRNSVEHGSETHATECHLTITVGSLDTDEGFFVADDGVGISSELEARIFERGVTETENGTGFGLAIVEMVAEAHGWRVTATDADGARFEVSTASEAPPLE